MNTMQTEQIELGKEVQRLEGMFEQIRNGEIYLCAGYIPCVAVSGLSSDYALDYKEVQRRTSGEEKRGSI